MRRLISLLALFGCAACAPRVVAQQVKSPIVGGGSNRAALIPSSPGQPPRPTPTPTPGRSPTAGPSTSADGWSPVRLTNGGCCPDPFWSADSREVRFLARPEPTQPASIYAIPRTGGPAKLVRREPALFSPDGAYTVTAAGETVVLERSQDGKRWTITTDGRGVRFSNTMRYIAWTESSDAFTNLNLIQRTIWIANLDGSQGSSVVTVVGGGFLGWTKDDAGILVSGGLITGGPRGVWRVSAAGGEPELLFEAEEVQGSLVSPKGGWLAFFVAFGSDPDRNGLWVMSTEDGSASLVESFGSYRWRDEGRLLIVPLVINQPGDGLWQYEATSDALTKLFGSGEVPFKVANNDWSVSPDGAYIAFRSGIDENIWTLALPTH